MRAANSCSGSCSPATSPAGANDASSALQQARVLPEEVERLLEDRQVLVARDQDGRERGAEVLPLGDADGDGRFLRGERVRGADRQARRSQHAHEMDDVLGNAARRRDRQRHRPAASFRHTLAPSRVTRGARLVEELRHDLRPERADVVLILQQHAGGVGNGLRVERDPVEQRSMPPPSPASRRFPAP